MKKCSNQEHKDNVAIYYCQDCKINICNKCSNYHKELFNNHIIHNLDNNKEIFIDICKEKGHLHKYEFYCKNHNQLCCVACISKLDTNGYGQHKDCDVCVIQNIKEEKKNQLMNNIKYLEDLSNNLSNTVNELKSMFNKIDERKEEIKSKIQNIFTKIRNALNERENELLLEVDNKYNDIFCNENIIKESEKLPNQIKLSLERGVLINFENDNNKNLSSILNDCINIEENISKIKLINDNIKKINLNSSIEFEFDLGEEKFEEYVSKIKTLGQLKEKNKNIDIDSLILKNPDEINKFNNLLNNQIKIKNIKLLYRASRDGMKLENIKEKINNKSNLIFLFFTGKNRIFGTYIKVKVEVKHNVNINDKDAFCFSLNNNKIYKNLISEYAIKFFNGYPIIVGNSGNGNGYYFQYNSNEINDSGLICKLKIYDFQKNNELTEGDNKFNELEIFEIYNN